MKMTDFWANAAKEIVAATGVLDKGAVLDKGVLEMPGTENIDNDPNKEGYYFSSDGILIDQMGSSNKIIVFNMPSHQIRPSTYSAKLSDLMDVIPNTILDISYDQLIDRSTIVYGEAFNAFDHTAHTIKNIQDLLTMVNGMPHEYHFLDLIVAHGNADLKPEYYLSGNTNNSAANTFVKMNKGEIEKTEKYFEAISAMLKAQARDFIFPSLYTLSPTELLRYAWPKYHPNDPTKGAIEWRGTTVGGLNQYLTGLSNMTLEGTDIVVYDVLTPVKTGIGNGDSELVSVYRRKSQAYFDNHPDYAGKYNARWRISKGLFNLNAMKKPVPQFFKNKEPR